VLNIVQKILKVFEQNNLFEEGVELIGRWSFLLYQKHLGVPEFPLRTQDIDFLIPYPFKGKTHEKFIDQLLDLGFQYEFRRSGTLYLYNAELMIEFITPEKGRGGESVIHVKPLGVKAIPLRFVHLLLDDPISITDHGIKILVPNPVNFCLHKLIISSRRRKIEKASKDFQQAIYTSMILDKKKVQVLFKTLPKPWQKAIINILEKNIGIMPLEAEHIEKLKLTLQSAIS
jgi:hypothetical protein